MHYIVTGILTILLFAISVITAGTEPLLAIAFGAATFISLGLLVGRALEDVEQE